MPLAQSIAFDDQSEVVPSVGFDFASVHTHLDGEETSGDTDAAALRRQTLARLFQVLTTGANAKPLSAKQAGQRLHVLAYLTGQSPCKNQRQLARLLGLSAGRVSQKLNFARRELFNLACAE
jgi:hypothetical protein